MHGKLLPVYDDSPLLHFPDVPLLHYAMVDAQRFARRQIWYQCFERLKTADFGPIQLYRRYHPFDVISDRDLIDVDPAWFSAYKRQGVDVDTIEPGPTEMFNRDILKWMTDPAIGPRKFARLTIWDINWNDEFQKFTGKLPPVDLSDPRSLDERMVHRWLARTQRNHKKISVRLIQRVLRLVGW